MSEFLTPLKLCNVTDNTWMLLEELVYESDLVGRIVVPAGFVTDLASVPRVPFAFWLWGERAHYEAVVHDYLYRRGSSPIVFYEVANLIFKEAMICRGKRWWVVYPMYWGVCLGGKKSYYKKNVNPR